MKKNTKKKIEKETRRYKVSYTKKDQNSFSTKIFVPLEWLEDMGLNPNDRIVEVTYRPRTKTLSIKKSSKTSKDDEE